jgi:uncharacterized membrane protein YdjX (TVP38/TMEM64 family)
MPDRSRHRTIVARVRGAVLAVLVLTVLAVAAYAFINHEPLTVLKNYLESRVHPLLFILLMAVLPICGVPISLFLVLVGMRFGIATGIALSAVTMLFHLIATYYLVHSFLRVWITGLLQRFSIPVPELQIMSNKRYAFVFMLVPGLPYVVKNNLLALTGLPLVPYLLIGWLSQFLTAISFVIFGGAVIEMNYSILALALVLILAGFLLQRFIRNNLPPSVKQLLSDDKDSNRTDTDD